jgi:hypothetical protein
VLSSELEVRHLLVLDRTAIRAVMFVCNPVAYFFGASCDISHLRGSTRSLERAIHSEWGEAPARLRCCRRARRSR